MGLDPDYRKNSPADRGACAHPRGRGSAPAPRATAPGGSLRPQIDDRLDRAGHDAAVVGHAGPRERRQRLAARRVEENRALRQRQDALSAERATLLAKNEQVRARVEAMIGRLKSMESGA